MAKKKKESTAPAWKNTLSKWFYVDAPFDPYFFILLIVIMIVGLATLYSASHVYAFNYNDGDSFFYIRKQAIFFVVGFVGMLIVSMVNYHILHKFAWVLWTVSLLLLVVALIMPSSSGVHRWIRFGGFQFQPSEVAKFALILLFAHYISYHYKTMKKFTVGFLPMVAVLGVTCGLVVLEPHLSGTILIGLLGYAMMLIGGVSIKWLLGLAGAGAGGVAFMLGVLKYEHDRIEVWRNPIAVFTSGLEGRDQAWQTVQSLYAIGSGGLLGQGLGNSRQKHLFLPEPQNDFIFAVLCEEVGFVGAIVVMILFALLVFRGISIGLKAKDKFGSLLAIGLVLQIGLQVAINVAVVSNLMPNTGISLPFFSYGGTSLVMLMLQMGVVLAVSRQSTIQKK